MRSSILLIPLVMTVASCDRENSKPPKAVAVPENAITPGEVVVSEEPPVALPVDEDEVVDVDGEEAPELPDPAASRTPGEHLDHALQKTGEGLQTAGEKTQEAAIITEERTKEGIRTAREKTETGLRKAADATGNFLKRAGEKIEEAGEKAEE
ncbi:hypothetical protein [Luteolibacter luteus]|uniref:Uncharacterized protein n=1 Tax=Luteolibacter luteus TaxID=2728835 RepID=A0A858RRV5_9BACT|nr:hypothetical protein [Luteolibacter luteus]QJE98673.1 hypothetical protein HHL09_23775 [Luteolibacter luteus]